MKTVGILAVVMGVLTWSASAQDRVISSRAETVSSLRDEPTVSRYILDVSGKRVRLVGPRFYTNPRNRLDFPGRDEPALENPDARR